MEPDDLNKLIQSDPQLEALLRHPASPLADEGFSSRVLAALPAQRPTSPSYRLICCWVGALVGCVVAWYDSSTRTAGISDVPALTQTVGNVADVVLDPTFILAVIIAAGSIAIAVWPRSLWQRLTAG